MALFLCLRARAWPTLAALCLLLAAILGLTSAESSEGHAADRVSVAVVQGALNNGVLSGFPTDEVSRTTAYETYSRLTLEAASSKPDLVIWPESSAPVDVRPGLVDPRLLQALKPAAQAIIGGYYRSSSGYYNAAFLWKNQTLSTAYLKGMTVPIAERQFARGHRQTPVEIEEGRVGIGICFEAAFPEVFRQSVHQRAEFLLVLTNDTWAERTNMEKWHLRASQFRAVETGRYLIHASRSGTSAIISDKGGITARLELQRQGILKGTIQKKSGETLFTRWGDWLGILSFFATCLGIIFSSRRAVKSPTQAKA